MDQADSTINTGSIGDRGSVAGEAVYSRSVDGIVVLDAQGSEYEFPFLGGLNVPRPSFVDIDGDADLDLFVQEVTGELIFFENQGSTTEPRLKWRTDAYKSLDIGEWYRFIDIDGDGDQDLLAEKPYSYMALIHNEGTPADPVFVSPTDSLRDTRGVPIFSDRQNIPNVNDLDCDDRLDLFIGRVDGTVRHLEANAAIGSDVPLFAFKTDRFEEIEIVGELQGSKHGANTMTFYDYDADGDRDLFWGDFFEPGLLLIQNTGTCANPVLQNEPVPFPRNKATSTSGYNNAVFADLDGDQKDEMYMGVLGGAFNPNTTASDNFYRFEQGDRPGDYTLRSTRFLNGLDLGSESVPRFADLDGDGDQDLLLANKIDATNNSRSSVVVYTNTGSSQEPQFQQTDTLKLHGAFHLVPALGDLDDDGDLDMLVGSWSKGISFYRNDGDINNYDFVEVDLEYLKLTRGSNAYPTLVDVDADGDLDLVIGESSGEINFYRNEGTKEEPTFVLESDKIGGLDVGRRSAPSFADVDGDGVDEMIAGRDRGAPLVFEILSSTPLEFGPATDF
ncbi:MAG: VCBS repeat-containing protein, partial [Rhodothermales bacterium]|nr:VCBS repeat-containing protein [Rhodothermales bacterium]